MATPTSNAVPVTDVDWSHLNVPGSVRGLLRGVKWGDQLGSKVVLTWSVAQAGSSKYSYNGHPDSISYLSSAAVGAVRKALKMWQSISNIAFAEVKETPTTVGEIRFAEAAHIFSGRAYYPSDAPSGGDVWLYKGFVADDRTHYSPNLLIHEIGHALGLKHPFENGGGGKVSAKFDTLFWTVMAYTAKHSPLGPVLPDFYPSTPMYSDIAAIQALYGRNMKHNAGKTEYVFHEGQKYWQTIDDVSGTDTIRYVGTRDSVIDLLSGKFSSVSDPITLGMDDFTRATVCIGPNTVIEKAIGDAGNDRIIGNSANNVLDGGAGNDVLMGGKGKDAFVFSAPLETAGMDRITDFNVKDDTIKLHHGAFQALSKGKLPAAYFRIGSGAQDADDHIIYDKGTGYLSYDPDGNDVAPSIVFAHLKGGLKLSAADFIVI